MQTLDQALADLVRRNVVAKEEALMGSSNPAKLQQHIQFQDEPSELLKL